MRGVLFEVHSDEVHQDIEAALGRRAELLWLIEISQVAVEVHRDRAADDARLHIAHLDWARVRCMRRVHAGLLDDRNERRRRHCEVVPRRQCVRRKQVRVLTKHHQPAPCMPAGVWELERLEVLRPHAVWACCCAARLQADDTADWEFRWRVEHREPVQ